MDADRAAGTGLPAPIRTELCYAVWLNAREANESRVVAVFGALQPAKEYANACLARRDEIGACHFGIGVCKLASPALAVIEWERS